MKKLLLLALSCLVLLNNPVFAQTGGKFDSTFGKNGFAEISCQQRDITFPTKKMDVTPDGKTISTVDFFDEDLEESFLLITRFDASGKLDKTFGANNTGEALIEWDNGDEPLFLAMAIQPDGKILVSGFSFDGNGVSIKLVRVTTNGALDPTFGVGGIAEITDGTLLATLAIQPLADGNIILAGITGDPIKENFDGMVCKVDSKGTIVKSFGNLGFYKMTGTSSSTLTEELITDIAVGANGAIVVAGYVSDVDEIVSEGLILRLTSAGKLDPTFSATGIKNIKGVTDDVLINVIGIDVQKDGKILALVSTDDGVTFENDLIRYNANGSTDLTFGEQGKTSVNYNADDLSFGIDLKILANNQIITAIQGYNLSSEVFYSAVNRYTTAGILDKKFADLGTSIVEIDSIEGVTGNLALAPNNSIIVMFEGEEVFENENYYQFFYRLLNPDVVGVKDEVVVLENVKIAPNPTFNTFTLSYNLEKNQSNVKIDLIDLEGRIVKNFADNENRQEGRNQEILDVSAVISGIYFLRIQTAEQVSQMKVVKI